jgi:hypothetical protein
VLNEITLLLVVTVLVCVTSCQKAAPQPEAQSLEQTGHPWGDEGGKVFKTREDVKAQFPTADWLETQQGEAKFIFCSKDLPAFGNSRIVVHGWVFRSHSNQWESVLTIRLSGVGKVTLSVDPNSGLFSAKGSANNKFMGQSVCTFDLRTAE